MAIVLKCQVCNKPLSKSGKYMAAETAVIIKADYSLCSICRKTAKIQISTKVTIGFMIKRWII